MALAMFGFLANDTVVKFLTADLDIGQILLVRGLFATTLVGLLAWNRGAFAQPSLALNPLVALRAFSELGATFLFLTALANMPLGNITAVLQSLPLAVTMGAALFLGEPVGWRRWLAIIIGFCGVVLIVRPGLDGFNAYAVYALGSVFFCAVRDLATRRVPDEVPSLLISTVTSLLVTVFGGMLVFPLGGGWTPIGVSETGLLATASVLVLIGYQFIIKAVRIGDIAFVAPFRYTALLWGVVFGFAVFNEWPDAITLAGAALVVGSGLYSLYRERRVGKTKPIAGSTGEAMAPDGV